MRRSSSLAILAALVVLAAPARTAEPEIPQRGKGIAAAELDGPGLARDWGSLSKQLRAVGLQGESLCRFVAVPRFEGRVRVQAVLEKLASANACELTLSADGRGAFLWRKAPVNDGELVAKHLAGGDPVKFSEAVSVAVVTEDLTVFRGLMAAVGKMDGPQKTEVIRALAENQRLELAAVVDRASCLLLCSHALAAQEVGLRSSAAAALGRVGGDEALGLLKTAVKDLRPLVRVKAVGSLTFFDQAAAGRLLREAAGDADVDVRSSALAALVLRGDQGSMELLEAAFGDEDGMVRSRAIRLLHLIDRGNAVRLAGKALADAEKGNRSSALRVLSLIGGPEIRDLLLERFKLEPEAYLRDAIRKTLWAKFPKDEVVKQALGDIPAKVKPPPLELGPVTPELF